MQLKALLKVVEEKDSVMNRGQTKIYVCKAEKCVASG